MKYVLLCLILLAIHISYAQEIDNLVKNSDFEAGIAPWTMWVEDANAVAVMEEDNKNIFQGNASLLIDIQAKGGGKRVELHQKHFNLKNGQELTYAFWAKADPPRPAKMICNHRAAPWTTYGAANISILEDWQEFWTTVKMTADDNKVGIYVELRDTKGQTWFDNFRFYEGEYFEEDFGQIDLSVQSYDKLATTWGRLKQKG